MNFLKVILTISLTLLMFPAQLSASDFVFTETVKNSQRIVDLGEFKLTAYCPCQKCCGKWSNGITSTGVTAQPNRTIAVDTDVIPYGSTVIIDGKEYVAEDCGGMVLALVENLHKNGFNYSRNLFVECGDIDSRCVHMAYLQLGLSGVPAVIYHRNALSMETWDVWHTPALCMQWLRFRHLV